MVLVSCDVERLFLVVPQGCLRFVVVVFPDHTHLLLLILLKEPSREKALLTLHVMTEMHFLLQKNLKNIMHGHVKMYVMR